MKTLLKFIRDTRGNIAGMTAVGAMVLMIGSGAALDHNRASSVQQTLQNTGDIGALAASAAFHRDTSLNKARLKKIARDAVDANCEIVFCGQGWEADITVTDSEVTVDMTAASPNFLMSIVGNESLPVSCRSVSGLTGTAGAYLDLYILADVLGSMNIPDSQAEIDRLMMSYRPWGVNCAFACHVPHESGRTSGYDVSQNLNLYLREHRIRDEIASLGTTLLRNGDGQVTLNIIPYTDRLRDNHMDIRTQTTLNDVIDDFLQSSDDTRSYDALPRMAGHLPRSGTGLTQSDPLVMALLITDGVDEAHDQSKDSIALNPASCDLLKAKADKLFVLNVVYPHPDTTDPGGHDRTTQVRSIYDQLRPNLQACASPDGYYEGEYGVDIAAAFQELIGEVGSGLYQEVRLVR